MKILKTSAFTALLGCVISGLTFAESPPTTTLVTPTSLIVATAFDQETPLMRKKPILDWSASIGQWQVKDGVLHGDEVAEDKHPSSCSYKLEATDLVITAKFRLGTAEHIAFGCRDSTSPYHHLARTYVSPKSIWIVRQSGLGKTTKSEKLSEIKAAIDPDAWHAITIEFCGDHYRARIGEKVIEGHHERYKDPKGLVVLITKGQGAQFKDVAIWHAAPRK
jgi:hypothetical protein